MTTSVDLTCFGLRASPFTKEIDDENLWLPESKTALVDDIEAALTDRQSVLLLGEPGVGKTCVLRALRRRLPQSGFRLTYLLLPPRARWEEQLRRRPTGDGSSHAYDDYAYAEQWYERFTTWLSRGLPLTRLEVPYQSELVGGVASSTRESG